MSKTPPVHSAVRSRTHIWTIGATVVSALLVNVLSMSSIGQDLNYRIATTLDFRLRDSLGKSPKLDPRIRIFGFDDKTLSVMKRPELYIEEWAKGISRLAADKPKVIIIDKMFSIIYDPNQKSREAIARLATLNVPVVVGSFITGSPIPYREDLTVDKKLYHLPFLLQEGVQLNGPPNKTYQELPSPLGEEERAQLTSLYPDNMKDFGNFKIYGPTRAFQNVFPYIGHLQYSGQTKAAPLVRISADLAVPHASVFAADSYRIRNGHFLVNNHKVPIDTDGEVVVNIANPMTYFKGLRRLNLILQEESVGRLVDEGDIVLLLLNMYTGGTDFHLTPYGYAPGGFILAAMMHSALTGEWLSKAKLGWFLISTSCVLGGVVGTLTATVTFWAMLILGLSFILSGGMVCFGYFSVITPWLWLSIGFAGNAIIVFAEKTRYTEKRAQHLQLVEAERKLLAKELKEASVMAEAYRPDPLPVWPGFLISAYHKPIHAASGDWYAFEMSESGRFYHFIMCDITGHGVQAALVASACKTLLGNIKRLKPDLLEAADFIVQYMQLLNATLWRQGRGQHVTTMLALSFEPRAQLVHFLAAGHPSPLLRQQGRADERPLPLISRHNPLGITPDCTPKPKTASFEPGDELLAFTDGIPLAENRKVLREFPLRDANNIATAAEDLYHLTWDRERQKHQREPDDDVSMLWFKLS